MFSFRGNITSEATSPSQQLSTLIKSFSLVNKTGGAITVNVYVTYDVAQISVIPYNLSLDANEMYEGTREILLQASQVIVVTTTGELDFDFTLENVSI